MSQHFYSLMPQTSISAIALAHLEAGDYHQAQQAFQSIPDSDRTVDDWVNQAVCAIHLEQPEAALVACDRALALNGNHPQAWLFKGVALHRLNRYDEAYACYDQASNQPDQLLQKSGKSSWYSRLGALRGVAKRILQAN